jgi:hypothetical protein
MIRLTRWSRRFHRWIAYGLGVVVLLWIVTGVVMMFPPPPTTRIPAEPPLTLRDDLQHPNAALQLAARTNSAPIRSLAVRHLGERPVFHVVHTDATHTFVDAVRGERIEFGDSVAADLARRAMLQPATPAAVTRLTAHDNRYRFGALPVYRFELGDAAGTLLHVAADGSVTSTSARGRVRAVMAALHEFQLPGGIVPNRPRKLMLLGASALTVGLIVTGYVLVLPLWMRRAADDPATPGSERA